MIKDSPNNGEETTRGTFTFDIAVNGNKLTLTNITCTNESLKDKLGDTRIGSLKSDGTLDGISITYNGTTLKLAEKSSSGGGDDGGDWGYDY